MADRSSIMVADARATRAKSEQGQSVIEFLFTLPLLLGLSLILMKVNAAIQMSIVNQQYARVQATYLTFNSPVYPALKFRTGGNDSFIGIAANHGANQMILGVADNLNEDESDGYEPSAQTQKITRNQDIGRDDLQWIPDANTKRGKVRIRTTISLCTQSNVVLTSEGAVPTEYVYNSTMRQNDLQKFDFCRYPPTSGLEGANPL